MSDSNRPSHGPQVVLARLWEKTSAKGTTYMTGRLGAARISILPNRDRQSEDDPTHVILVSEASDGGSRKQGGAR